MRFNQEDTEKLIEVRDEMEMYVEIASDLIKTCEPLMMFAGHMGAMASDDPDCQDPVAMFSYAFTLGMAKTLHDINKGYINFKTITTDLGEKHEDNQGPDSGSTAGDESWWY